MRDGLRGKEKDGRSVRPSFCVEKLQASSIGFEFGDGAQHVFGLGEDGVFELGRVF